MSELENITFVETSITTDAQIQPIIHVIGVGGGGSNAVSYMYRKGITGVNFYICNTDAQALMSSPVPNRIAIGLHGAGGDPKIGAQRALEHLDDIKAAYNKETRMVFLTTCMGGGTGTGAAPIIAKAIKEEQVEDGEISDILLVAVVTMPFFFEGRKRLENARKGIAELKKYADSVIIISNDKLRSFGNKSMSTAFALADDILCTATKSIAEIITKNLLVNIDYHDVYSIMSKSKTALMGCGEGEGENRAQKAIEAASSSVLLDDQDIRNAKGCLMSITSSSEHEMTMDEFDFLSNYVYTNIIDSNDPDSNVIWGVGCDESLGEKIQVTLIVTGFKNAEENEVVEVKKEEIKAAHEPRTNVDDVYQEQSFTKNNAPLDDDIQLKPVEPVQQPEAEKSNQTFVVDLDDNVITSVDEPRAEEQPTDDSVNATGDKIIETLDDEPLTPTAETHQTDNETLDAGTFVSQKDETMTQQPLSIYPEPEMPYTPTTNTCYTDNDFKAREDRVRKLKELLSQGQSGIDTISQMDLVHNIPEQIDSSVSEASDVLISSDGSFIHNIFKSGNPD